MNQFEELMLKEREAKQGQCEHPKQVFNGHYWFCAECGKKFS